MSFEDLIRADRRLVLLRLLNEAPDYQANDSLLTEALPGFTTPASRDQVRAELAWLEEQGLVSTRTVEGGGHHLVVATLTERGSDVQAGRARVPGVKRPAPGD